MRGIVSDGSAAVAPALRQPAKTASSDSTFQKWMTTRRFVNVILWRTGL